MYQAKMPYQLQDYLVEHAVQIKNRLPTIALPFGNEDHFMSTSVTLYAAYTGTLPDFKDLYTFGYKAMPRKLETQFLKSFEPRTKEDKWVLIGMQGNHIQKLLNVTTLREVKSVDYSFNEYIFLEFDSEFKET